MHKKQLATSSCRLLADTTAHARPMAIPMHQAAEEAETNLLPERPTNCVATATLSGSVAIAHHGIQGQRLEGCLRSKGGKICLQRCLLTAPGLSVSIVLLLQIQAGLSLQSTVSSGSKTSKMISCVSNMEKLSSVN